MTNCFPNGGWGGPIACSIACVQDNRWLLWQTNHQRQEEGIFMRAADIPNQSELPAYPTCVPNNESSWDHKLILHSTRESGLKKYNTCSQMSYITRFFLFWAKALSGEFCQKILQRQFCHFCTNEMTCECKFFFTVQTLDYLLIFFILTYK